MRDLKRAIESLLYERTDLNTRKEVTQKRNIVQNDLKPEDVFLITYMMKLLGLNEKTSYSESVLEESIISNLHHFLIETAKGFGFECWQKRTTFDNKHCRIDLVFYYRILKPHICLTSK